MSNLYEMPPEIQVTADGGLRVITLNRPEDMNAASTAMLYAMADLWERMAADDGAQVAILTGAGRAFSAGGDFQHFVRTLDDPKFAADIQELARRSTYGIINLPVPVIAAVNGPAVGFGGTLATLSDIVLMSDKAFIAEPHINIGLVVGDGISVSWPLYTGLLKAKELIYTGDRISAEQAVEFGLANRVVPHDQLMDEAMKLAGKLLRQPRNALRNTKKIMNLYLRQAADNVLETMTRFQLDATLSDEHQTISRAFLDKQKRNEGVKGKS